MSLITNNDLTQVRKSIRQGWEEVAPEYDKDRLGIFERYAGRLLDLLHPSSGSRLLDVGCGSGAVVLQAVERVGSTGSIVGFDISGAMLRLGRRKASQEGFNIAFCQMDAEFQGLASGRFDSVTCAFSLFQFPDMDQALTEMWRVLKPGGCLGLSNWGPGYFSPIAELQKNLFRKFKIKPLLTNPLFFEPAELENLLIRNGFTSIELFDETDEVWFTIPEEAWAFNMDMGPFPMMLRSQLPIDQQEELTHQFHAMLEERMSTRGIQSTFHLLYALARKGASR